jgi:cathepsin D
MFKFKMLTKVLVAVFFYGLIIELNLNLCIALSIDLSGSAGQFDVDRGAKSSSIDSKAELELNSSDDDEQGALLVASASRTLQSASASTYTDNEMEPETDSTTDAKTVQNSMSFGPARLPPQQQQQVSSEAASSSSQLKPLVQRLESNGRSNYFGKILVGENQVPFYVLFDLASTNFWLPSSECKSNHCLGRQKYNKSSSTTYAPDDRRMDVAFDRGITLKGGISVDSVTLAGVKIEQQPFGEITELEGELLGHLPVDGFMGLGYKELAATRNDTADQRPATPIERLWQMGLISEPVFSLSIKADVEQYKYSTDNGALTLGRIADEYSPDELTYVPVTHTNYWEFHLSGVTVRNAYGDQDLERGCESACPAILDTRYPLIAGHFADVDRINKALGGFPVGNGLYRLSTCDLGVLPYLVFQIGGTDFTLAPQEYVEVRTIRGFPHACYSTLMVVEAEQYPFWVLGEFFLKRHYVLFDYAQKRIGFARSKTMPKPELRGTRWASSGRLSDLF